MAGRSRRAGSGGTGALAATLLGTGTTALVLKSALVRGWLFHGAHLTASAVYGRELYASMGATFYGAICVLFPMIGLVTGLVGAASSIAPVPRADADPPRPRGPACALRKALHGHAAPCI